MRVALVHDYLNQYGGAERVLETLHELYPDAPVYTSLYDPDAMPDHFRTWDIRTSFLQRMPLVRRFHRAFPRRTGNEAIRQGRDRHECLTPPSG